MRIRLGAISLDCARPAALATFWAELLGGDVIRSNEQEAVVRLGDLLLTASRVDRYLPPTWPGGPLPKQAHIDLVVDDLDGAERRAIALGALRPTDQPEPETRRVLFDPAGHPFCLSVDLPE